MPLVTRFLIAPVLFALLPMVGASTPADDDTAQKKPPVLQVLALDGAYVDRPVGPSLDPMSLLTGGGVKQKSFFKLCEALERLGKDEEVQHILFDLSSPAIGMGSANVAEFSRHMAELRKTGKRTYAWLENAGPGHYAIAAECDEVIMADFATFDFPSRAMSSMHYKDALDLLGIRASVARVGDFKGAVEPYTNSTMSSHLRSHYLRMLTSLNDTMVAQVAKRRGLTHEAVRAAQKRRVFTASMAHEHGLVDRLAPYGAMRTTIEARCGEAVSWREKVEGPQRQPSFFELWAKMMSGATEEPISDAAIAVLHLSGTIIDGNKAAAGSMVSGPTVEAIDRLTNDARIKGVVIRIDSPGGSATASEAIRRALMQLVEAKPAVVSMGGVAASGGYWISCLDRPVYAEASTVTGSIGVFAMKLSFGPLMKRIGVHVENICLDESAAAMGIDREWSPDDIGMIESMIVETYDRFLALVSKSRGLTVEEVDAVGGGRVWSGAQAKALGLVDHLGGVDVALAALSGQIEEMDCQVIHRPKPSSGFNLMELLGGDEDEIRALLPLAGLRLLTQQGFNLNNLLTILNSSLRNPAPGLQIWLLNTDEITIR